MQMEFISKNAMLVELHNYESDLLHEPPTIKGTALSLSCQGIVYHSFSISTSVVVFL